MLVCLGLKNVGLLQNERVNVDFLFASTNHVRTVSQRRIHGKNICMIN